MVSIVASNTSYKPTELSPEDKKVLFEAFKKWIHNCLGESVKVEQENPTSDKGKGQDNRDRGQDAPSNNPSQVSCSRPSTQANYRPDSIIYTPKTIVMEMLSCLGI